MKKTLILTAFVYMALSMPSVASAFQIGQLIDPACFFACDRDNDTRVIYYNNQPPISRQTTVPRAPTTSTPTPTPVTVINNNYNYNTNTNNIDTDTDTDNHRYDSYPVYNDYYDYHSSPTYSSLNASCYANSSNSQVDEKITWRASVSGGSGDYYITWSGSENLSGNGTSITKRYDHEGTKYASIRVSSGGQTITRNCDNVEIYDYDNNNYSYNSYDYNNTYSLVISCSADTTFAPVNTSVAWRAYVSGGNGDYRYTWNGTDYLNGSGQYITATYHSSGVKNASITVRSGNQTMTQLCSNSVTVGTPTYGNNNSNDIQVACYADKLSVLRGSIVKWSVEAVGGSGNFTYSWTGSEGLSGTGTTIVTSYDATGVKTASVTARASNGQTATQFCGNSVTVKNAAVASTVVKKPVTDNSSYDSLSASSLFSVKNIPWGWVMVLIMLVMMAAILFLIFTRNKNR